MTARSACGVLIIAAVLATSAHARPTEHFVGLGLGVGVRVASQDLAVVSPELGVPALEMGPFLGDDRSLEFSIPIVRMILSAALVERLWLGFDLYPTFRVSLEGPLRFVAGPGIGWMVSAGGGNGTAGLRGGGRIGVELRSPGGGFALALLLQPSALVEFGDVGVAVSGGVMTWVRWTWIRR